MRLNVVPCNGVLIIEVSLYYIASTTHQYLQIMYIRTIYYVPNTNYTAAPPYACTIMINQCPARYIANSLSSGSLSITDYSCGPRQTVTSVKSAETSVQQTKTLIPKCLFIKRGFTVLGCVHPIHTVYTHTPYTVNSR